MTDRAGAAKGWHPEDIKAQLRKRHGPITHLAVSWGYARNAITSALGGQKSWAAIERRIAAALGVTPHTLWPDRWSPKGARRPQAVICAQASRPRSTPHREKRGAA